MGDYLLLRIIGIALAFSVLVSSDELVVKENGEILQVTPSIKVKDSPGMNPENITSLCERIRISINGSQRLSEQIRLYFTHSFKLIVNASNASNASNIDVCLHRNVSLAIGMCRYKRWEKVVNGSWILNMSPFDQKFIDVRVSNTSNVTLQVKLTGTEEDWFLFRIVFLTFSTLLLIWAPELSKSMTFYYSSCFTVGLILVALLSLFWLKKYLPTTLMSYSRLTCFCSSLLGLSYVIYYYIPPRVLQLMSRGMGFGRGLDDIALLLYAIVLYAHGLYLGVVAINSKLLLTEDGDIDVTTSVFISWSTRIFVAVLILQSSQDTLLAGGALMFLIIMSPILRIITSSIFRFIIPPFLLKFIMNLLVKNQKRNFYAAGVPLSLLALYCNVK